MALLGDPHLGRTFIHGVPLNRRGEREAMQWEQFTKHIINPEGDLHICMGDLFDKAIVPYSVILNAAYAYATAASLHPDVQFVILKGNHDWQRDLERPSAFDVFKRIVNDIPNIHVVSEHYQIGKNLFCAWHPTIPAAKMVTDYAYDSEIVYGHWDIEDFGGENLNLIPTKEMKALRIYKAYTGHIHKPQQFERDNVDVTVVGSMQPYAHGEQINDDLYVTYTKKALAKINPSSYRNKCVRVDLSASELLDTDVDCLQLTVRKERKDGEKIEVTLGDFNMTDLFKDSFKEAGVSDTVTDSLLGKYEASRISDA